MNKMPHRGFTVVEIVIVGFLIGLFGAAIVGERTTMTETSKRIQCASNLKQIGLACLLYANENKGFYPRTRHDPAVKKWPAYSNYKAKDPFADDGPEVNDVTAPLYLLMRTQDITSAVFICPSSSATKFEFEAADKNALDFSNFPNKSNLSYSYANPYMEQAENPLTTSISAEFAVAADMNPGGEELFKLAPPAPGAKSTEGNSENHNREGENVLFGDGHVEWTENPFVGVTGDNIYTPGEIGDSIVGPSVNANDSILLPTAKQEPEKPK